MISLIEMCAVCDKVIQPHYDYTYPNSSLDPYKYTFVIYVCGNCRVSFDEAKQENLLNRIKDEFSNISIK